MPRLRLNKNRPYAQVFGLPGVSWEQDGEYFRLDGALIGDPINEPDEPDVLEVKAPPRRNTAEEEEFLRTQLQIYNQPWTTTAAARKFLAGREDA